MIKKLFIVVVVVMMTLFAVGAGCIPCVTKETYQVRYEITGTAQAASITYMNEHGGVSDSNDVRLPWKHSFKGKEGDYIWVHASSSAGSTGSITVTIYRDGKLFEQSTGTGRGTISVSGTL